MYMSLYFGNITCILHIHEALVSLKTSECRDGHKNTVSMVSQDYFSLTSDKSEHNKEPVVPHINATIENTELYNSYLSQFNTVGCGSAGVFEIHNML